MATDVGALESHLKETIANASSEGEEESKVLETVYNNVSAFKADADTYLDEIGTADPNDAETAEAVKSVIDKDTENLLNYLSAAVNAVAPDATATNAAPEVNATATNAAPAADSVAN